MTEPTLLRSQLARKCGQLNRLLFALLHFWRSRDRWKRMCDELRERNAELLMRLEQREPDND